MVVQLSLAGGGTDRSQDGAQLAWLTSVPLVPHGRRAGWVLIASIFVSPNITNSLLPLANEGLPMKENSRVFSFLYNFMPKSMSIPVASENENSIWFAALLDIFNQTHQF